ncbi:hypothetical protein [Sphingomonas sp.]|uniref:hypothetical protein n=1 Tax=Sphingomonas sp. TaxID=28214 RepID=UPI003F727D7C
MGADSTDFRNDVLLQEYLRLCAEIRSIESTNERVISLALTVLGFAAAFGIARDISIAFLLLPVAFIGLMTFAAMNYVSIFSLAGYKKHLEDLINEAVGEKLLLWERLVPEREKRNLLGGLMLSIYVLAGLAMCAVSIWQLYTDYSWLVASGVSIGLLVLVAVLGLGVRRMRKTANEAYSKSKMLRSAGR